MSRKPTKRLAELPPLDEDERDDAAFRARDRAWAALVGLFDHYQRTEKLSYEQLGRRIGRTRSQVQRWLSSAFCMNLRSLGLLAEGLDADLIIDVCPRSPELAGRNYCHPGEAARELIASRTSSSPQLYEKLGLACPKEPVTAGTMTSALTTTLVSEVS